MNISPTQCKVGLVAVASNEAAYLTEWVHHHLSMGFSPIEILVNRTQDRSEALIDQISKSNPAVRSVNVDYLDKESLNNLQLRAYAEAYSRLKDSLNADDYIMHLDIDEFFMPVDQSDTVHSVLEKMNFPSILELNWFVVTSDTFPFAPLWAEKIQGRHHALTKVAYRVGLDIEEIRVHGIVTKSAEKIWTARGTTSQSRAGVTHPLPPETFNTAFVAHRMFRSPMEYLAILGRRWMPCMVHKSSNTIGVDTTTVMGVIRKGLAIRLTSVF